MSTLPPASRCSLVFVNKVPVVVPVAGSQVCWGWARGGGSSSPQVGTGFVSSFMHSGIDFFTRQPFVECLPRRGCPRMCFAQSCFG